MRSKPKPGTAAQPPTDPVRPKPPSPGTGPTKPKPLPRPRRPGRPKGQTTGEQPVSTKNQPQLPAKRSVRRERPGAEVETARNGKTYEGKTGVSGETAEDDDEQ
jgi:hypothetical protein